jgi:trigger factor
MARRKDRTPLKPEAEAATPETSAVSQEALENAATVPPSEDSLKTGQVLSGSGDEPVVLSEEEAARAIEALAALAEEDEQSGSTQVEETSALTEEETAEEKLSLEVQIQEKNACERHIVVTIPREEIEKYFQRELDELAETAVVPGFRPGRAPRKLIERRFRKAVADSVKMALIMDAIEQVTNDYKLSPIGEPELDFDAVLLPEEGPLTFEYDLEVRPSFELPDWRGIRLEAWKVEVTDEEIDEEIRHLLESAGTLEPYDGPAELGDYVVVDLKFTQADRLIAESSGEVIRIKKVLGFLDAEIPNFDELMVGVRPGDVRQCMVHVSPNSPDLTLRDTDVLATFTVREVKRLRVPELSPELLAKWGVETEAQLREQVASSLLSRKQFASRRHLRRQISQNLLRGASWDVPQRVLISQTRRELRRVIFEMQANGMRPAEIDRLIPQIANDLVDQVADSLREHFIFEGIAEQLGLTVQDWEVSEAIRQMASQRGISPRRLRAQLERQGGLDIIVNMILERKVLEAILSEAHIVEVPMPRDLPEVEMLQRSVGTFPADVGPEVIAEELSGD